MVNLLSKRCKTMVWVVLTCLWSVWAVIALADSSPGISLEEAIKIVKHFEVLQEFQEFSPVLLITTSVRYGI